MSKMTYQQIECVEASADKTPSTGARIVVWTENKRVKVYDVVTFKETGDKQWRVTKSYGTVVSEQNRGWGLDLPKSQRTER